MRRTIEISERLAIGPAGLTRRSIGSEYAYPVTGSGYDAYNRHSFLTIDYVAMIQNYPITRREVRQAKLKGWALGVALLGLFGAACWFGWIGLTNL